ncbi:MAG: type VI secretion protein [Sulfobacillus benefaciens]|uniref:Type VI secretion protein n=1 Tax=Sulfobacillus benefaciens TaxID=453960 RepID=A0A2T2XFD2_9FIRM|nr:MAG: type VI secretion protein [Sulfobacillus benefaciens]
MAVSLNRLLPIRAIGPGICLIGRDRFSLIMEATPVNFSLRSLGDQDRLIHGYTAFLNGLHFPVELLVRSDVLRLDDYLGDLKSREEEIEPALRPSLGDYIDFIQEAVSVHHLLRRRFFVILPWQGSDSRSRPLRRGEVLWQEAEQELFRRRDIIIQGLRPLGIRLRMFSTEETFRFFYASLGGGQPLPPGVNWAWD